MTAKSTRIVLSLLLNARCDEDLVDFLETTDGLNKSGFIRGCIRYVLEDVEDKRCKILGRGEIARTYRSGPRPDPDAGAKHTDARNAPHRGAESKSLQSLVSDLPDLMDIG